MTTQEALVFLATSTSAAAADALRVFAPEDVGSGSVSVVLPGREPFHDMPLPAVTSSISYTDDDTGGSIFVMPVTAARKLAAAMMGAEPETADGEELSELELSAAGEAMNQMMAAAAASTSNVLDLEIDISPPEVRVANSTAELKVGFQGAVRATVAMLSLFGETCSLVSLVPPGFTMRLSQTRRAHAPAATDEEIAREELRDAIRSVPLRVCVELGRARMPSLNVASLGDGAIVDLDRAADDPVDLFVNGSRFATGRLVVDGDAWAVRVEHVFHRPEPLTLTVGGIR